MGVVHPPDGIFPGALQRAAQGADGRAALLHLLVAGGVFALEGQEQPAHLQIGQAQLGQHVQRGHGPGDHDIKAFPHGLFLDIFLCPAGDRGDGDVQGVAALLDEPDALGGGIQGGDVKLGVIALQRHGGKARAAADVQHFFALKIRHGEQKQAVQHMPQGDLLRLGDGGEVHHPVFFDEPVGKPLHPGDGLRCDGQLPLPAALGHDL